MILSDRPIDAYEYAEAYSGLYFFNCSTYNECRDCLASRQIYIPEGEKMTEFNPKDGKNYVLVGFSTEEDYTKHEYRWMTVQKKYLKRFMERLEDIFNPVLEDEKESCTA